MSIDDRQWFLDPSVGSPLVAIARPRETAEDIAKAAREIVERLNAQGTITANPDDIEISVDGGIIRVSMKLTPPPLVDDWVFREGLAVYSHEAHDLHDGVPVPRREHRKRAAREAAERRRAER